MAGQVSVGDFQQVFQGIEIHPVVHHEYRHDPQPDPAFEYFIQLGYDILHPLAFFTAIDLVPEIHDRTVDDMQQTKSDRPENNSVPRENGSN